MLVVHKIVSHIGAYTDLCLLVPTLHHIDLNTKVLLLRIQNTPNDLQMLSDAPAHHIFCLLGPVDPTSNTLPEVLCVLQVYNTFLDALTWNK